MIELTVAMPVWKSREIVWLAMEGLCQQAKPAFEWELVIDEEQIDQAGKAFFNKYQKRLYEVGCVAIKYYGRKKWVSPSLKWVNMASMADANSKAFLIQDADDYSHPTRIVDAHSWIADLGFDWYQIRRGHFYDIPTGQMMRYSKQGDATHLMLALKTEHARTLPSVDKNRLLNRWIYDHTKKQAGKAFRQYTDEGDYNLLDTCGHNHITASRSHVFNDPQPPFEITDCMLEDIVPANVVQLLEKQLTFFKEKPPLKTTIIIPAYKTADTLPRLFKSIANQTKQPSSILIGVDGCRNTLAAVYDSCPAKLRKKLKVYWFPENVGTYRVMNTLAMEAGDSVLLFFGADDEMYPNIIQEMKNDVLHGLAVRPFADRDCGKKPIHTHGIFGITRRDFLNHGGFEPWVCAADSEFIQRSQQFGQKWKEQSDATLLVHTMPNSLTQSKTTGLQSKKRLKYRKEISRRTKHPVNRSFVEQADCVRVTKKEAKEIAETSCVSLILPWPDTNDSERVRAARHVLRWWQTNFPEISVVTPPPQQGPNGYWKSKVVNDAVEDNKSNIVIVSDADVIPSSVESISMALSNIQDFAVPFNRINRLTKQATEEWLDGNTLSKKCERKYNVVVGGGLFIAKRASYLKCGGMPEEISGWGCEDFVLGKRMEKHGDIWQGSGVGWHLWHTRQPSYTDGTKENNIEKARRIVGELNQIIDQPPVSFVLVVREPVKNLEKQLTAIGNQTILPANVLIGVDRSSKTLAAVVEHCPAVLRDITKVYYFPKPSRPGHIQETLAKLAPCAPVVVCTTNKSLPLDHIQSKLVKCLRSTASNLTEDPAHKDYIQLSMVCP